jgi:beta-fructofuranosidase
MHLPRGWNTTEMGDMDVIAHGDRLHCFHLCLPSHDTVAHLVSEDGMNWTPVANALRTGDPGACDDDQIWTMHVFPWKGRFHMLYTALAKAEDGRLQRTGLAVSDDLLKWEKVAHNPVAAPDPRWYEADTRDSGRADWRDPFPWIEGDTIHALLCAHEKEGPYNRRGCVAHLVSKDALRWEVRPPIYAPGVSGDFEVPAVFRLGDRLYMTGHIVTPPIDVYRVASKLEGPWERPADDVLLPSGNHAFTPVVWRGRTLLYHWISAEFDWHPWAKGMSRALAPPKEAVAGPSGELILRSFEPGWRAVAAGAARSLAPGELADPSRAFRGEWSASAQGVAGRARPGMGFLRLPGTHADFILDAKVFPRGARALGAAWRSDETADQCTRAAFFPGRRRAELHRILQGVNYNALGRGHKTLQEAPCAFPDAGPFDLRVVAWGPYIEVSVDQQVLLSALTMSRREGCLGFFVEDGEAVFGDVRLTALNSPQGL